MRLVFLTFVAFAEPYAWDLPKGFPPPRVPADNPMTSAKVELGRYLFYDARISVNGKSFADTVTNRNWHLQTAKQCRWAQRERSIRGVP